MLANEDAGSPEIQHPASSIYPFSGWPADPGCSYFAKEQLRHGLRFEVTSAISGDASTGVAGHVFKFAFIS
jgi:hypothetical protein